MSAVVPAHISKEGARELAPGLIKLLEKATAAAVEDFKNEAVQELSKA